MAEASVVLVVMSMILSCRWFSSFDYKLAENITFYFTMHIERKVARAAERVSSADETK